MIQKVLIADDEPDLLVLYAQLFEMHGFEVCTASNAAELETVFYRENPDLILLDIIFGTDSGPDVYDRLMKNASAPKTPVIFVSGQVDSRSESPMVRGRQVAMYSKPVSFDRLVQDIRRAFSETASASESEV